VASVIDRAKAYPVKGLYRLEEFPEPPPTTSFPSGLKVSTISFR
jgi:hypothetical protein